MIAILVVEGVVGIDEVALLVNERTHDALLSWIELEEVVVGLETRHGFALQRLHFLWVQVPVQESIVSADEVDVGRVLRLPVVQAFDDPRLLAPY